MIINEVIPGVATEEHVITAPVDGPEVPTTAPDNGGSPGGLLAHGPGASGGDGAVPRRTPVIRRPAARKVKTKVKAKAKVKAKKRLAAGAGRPAILKPTARITVLTKKNPWRTGSKAQAEFAKFRTGATVAATLKRGVRPRFLLWSRKLKHVKISA